jgi:hypothetical protein
MAVAAIVTMPPASAAPATKAIKVIRLKMDRRGGVVFPDSEEVFIVVLLRWRDDEQSACPLLAKFAGSVKICKARLDIR